MERPIGESPQFVHRVRDLPAGKTVGFDLQPDATLRAAIAADAGVEAVRKLRFRGRLVPQNRADWRLEAKLGATIQQACVVTLAPVVTRIDVPVGRMFLADPPDLPDGDEIEMPEDDSVEPLPDVIDLRAILLEALMLAAPDYPHAAGVAPVSQSFAAPGTATLTDDDTRPFADLRARLDEKKK